MSVLDLDQDPEREFELGLICPWDGGQKISRQGYGIHCWQFETTGTYVQLRSECKELEEYFQERWLRDNLDDASVAFLMGCLETWGLGNLVKVSGPPYGCEAFLDVEIIGLRAGWPPEIRLGRAVLTWPNCD